MTNEDFETLGQLVDRLDAATYLEKLPLPDKLHKEAFLGAIKQGRDDLKAFLLDKGFNPWEDEP